MTKCLAKRFTIYITIFLIVSNPFATLIQAQESSFVPTPESTPTPTLSYRERSRLQTQELLNPYYTRYGITPRPTQTPTPTPSNTEEDLTPTPPIQPALVEEPTQLITPTVTLSPSPTLSADNDPSAINESTGSDSSNSSNATESTETTLVNFNETAYADTFEESFDTGFNSASSVTGNLTLASGDANLTFSETNQFNSNVNSTPHSGGNETSPSNNLTQSQNQNTGSNSENIAQTETTNLTVIENTNILNLDQKGQIDVNTGFNLTESIIGDSTIATGDANVSVNLVNLANTNLNQNTHFQVANYEIYDQAVDDLVIEFENFDDTGLPLSEDNNEFEEMNLSELNQLQASNENTQPNSFNESSAQQSEETLIQNNNQATLDQELEVNVNTGGNVADGHTGATTITTGNINLAVNAFNFLNANLNGVVDFMIATVDIFGEMLGDLIFPDLASNSNQATYSTPGQTTLLSENNNTGSDSVNMATTNSETLTQIVNTNELTVENTVEMNLVTGANEISSTNGAVSLQTGPVESNVNSQTVGNINSSSGSQEVFWLIVVNNLGEWTGQILGFEGENFAIVEGFSYFNQEDVTASSSNTNTLGEANLAETEYQKTTTIQNTNTAEIEMNLTINAATGGNLVNSNNGPVTVQTGEIKTGVNLVNLANFNLTGKTVLLAVVNVFGKFLGNILPPGWVGIPELDEAALPLSSNPENHPALDETYADREEPEETEEEEEEKEVSANPNYSPNQLNSEPESPDQDSDSGGSPNDDPNDNAEGAVGGPHEDPPLNEPPAENNTGEETNPSETNLSDSSTEPTAAKSPEPNLPEEKPNPSSMEAPAPAVETPPDLWQKAESLLATQLNVWGISLPESEESTRHDVKEKRPAKFIFASTNSATPPESNPDQNSLSLTTVIVITSVLISLFVSIKRSLKYLW